MNTEHATLQEHRRISDAQYIKRLLLKCNWNVAEAARVAGISRAYLYDLIHTSGFKRPYRPRSPFARQTIRVRQMEDGDSPT